MVMGQDDRRPFIRNVGEVRWKEFRGHGGGALSKPLVMPETAGSRHIDYRISMYQPMARVELHKHKVQEQVYHVLEGEGLMEIAGKKQVVRRHDVIFLPPGFEHSIENTGVADLVFLVVNHAEATSTSALATPPRRMNAAAITKSGRATSVADFGSSTIFRATPIT